MYTNQYLNYPIYMKPETKENLCIFKKTTSYQCQTNPPNPFICNEHARLFGIVYIWRNRVMYNNTSKRTLEMYALSGKEFKLPLFKTSYNTIKENSVISFVQNIAEENHNIIKQELVSRILLLLRQNFLKTKTCGWITKPESILPGTDDNGDVCKIPYEVLNNDFWIAFFEHIRPGMKKLSRDNSKFICRVPRVEIVLENDEWVLLQNDTILKFQNIESLPTSLTVIGESTSITRRIETTETNDNGCDY